MALSLLVINSIRVYRKQSLECKNWPTVPMHINILDIIDENGDEGQKNFRLNVRYSYTYEQREYQSSVIAFYFPKGGTNRDMFELTRDKIKDLKSAYINPSNPSSSVLLASSGHLLPVPYFILYGLSLLGPQCAWVAIYVLFVNKSAVLFPI